MPTDAKALILEFCEAFTNGATPTALVEYFTEDAVYHNIPVEPAVGREAILGLLNIATALSVGNQRPLLEPVPGIEGVEPRDGLGLAVRFDRADELQLRLVTLAGNAEHVACPQRGDRFPNGERALKQRLGLRVEPLRLVEAGEVAE